MANHHNKNRMFFEKTPACPNLIMSFISCLYFFFYYYQKDKDFVWSLWKNLQVEKPEMANIIGSVVERYVRVYFIFYFFYFLANQSNNHLNIYRGRDHSKQTKVNKEEEGKWLKIWKFRESQISPSRRKLRINSFPSCSELDYCMNY